MATAASSKQWPTGPDAPAENIDVYRVLFAVETILRELVIEVMQTAFGPLWYREKLPSEALEHFKGGVERDRITKWTSNVPHHPVYYLTFPDLRATIESKANWNGAFGAIFPKNKDLFTTDLFELEFIRNKVAHNRRATPQDLAIARAAYEKLCNQLGAARARELSKRYSVAGNIPDGLAALRREGDIGFALSLRGRKPRQLARWHQSQTSWWWFDQSYLGHSLNRISAFFATLDSYCSVDPRMTSAARHAWFEEQQFTTRHTASRSDLTVILGDWGTPTTRPKAR